jgi:hypothetical protein
MTRIIAFETLTLRAVVNDAGKITSIIDQNGGDVGLGGGGGTAALSASLTITPANAAQYNGQTFEMTTAVTITLAVGLPSGFGFAVIPPATGNATIASDGTVLLNGATTALTRTAASNAAFAVIQRVSSANSYVVSGA